MTSVESALGLGVQLRERVLGFGPKAADQARSRSRALERVLHQGVLKPLEVVMEPSGRVVTVMPHVEGDDLAAVLRLRGSLQLGECVTLGVGIALALAAMHRAGIAHGDIAPSNVMVAKDRITLVDTMGGAMDNELGTPGYAAPERHEGASAPADMFSLGRILLDAVQDSDKERISAWVMPLLTEDASVRPTAAMTARALAACAEAEPIQLPAHGVVDAVRARAGVAPVVTVRHEAGRGWRLRRKLMRWGAGGVLAVCAALVLLEVGPKVWNATFPPTPPGYDPAMPIPVNAAVSPVQGAEALVIARFAAIANGDGQALLATARPDSRAHGELLPLAEALDSGALLAEGLEVAVDSVEQLSFQGRSALVIVEYTLSAHAITDQAGTQRFDSYAQAVELDLRWLPEGGWLVDRARAIDT